MIKIKDYEFKYEHEGGALEVTTPDGTWLSMNCEGLEEEAIRLAVKKFKFYPENHLRKLLDKGKNYEEAYLETKKLVDTIDKMKSDLRVEE